MPTDHELVTIAEALRAKAEQRFSQEDATSTGPNAIPNLEDARRVIYELHVHQIELEMQNEELRRTQAELESTKSRYFDLYDLAPVGYCTLSEEGMIQETNLTLADLLGETRGKLLHQPLSRFVFSQDQDIYYLHRQFLTQTGRPRSCESRMVRKDGTVFRARLDSSFSRDPGGLQTCRVMIADISETHRLADEKRRMESRIGQYQRLESLGALAAGVAHNLNNVLASIMGAASLHQSTAKDPSDIKAFGIITTACTRGRDIVRSLLQFARPALVHQGTFEMHALISEIRVVLASTTRNRIEVVEDFCQEPLWAKGEASNMSGAIMNLCINSIGAMPDGGTLRLKTISSSSDTMEIIVSDTGEGMPADVVARAFEPFFTTKGAGKGTGLGLSVTHGVITAHGGSISIESRPQSGTSVKIRLPRVAMARGEETKAAIQPATRHDSLDVMVVDDDTDVRLVVASMLESMGHRATTVSSGEEALDALRTSRPADLIVLDQNMPGKDGSRTLSDIRRLHPTLPVLISSGQLDIESSRLFDLPFVAVLAKPFNLTEFQEKFEGLLPGSERPPKA